MKKLILATVFAFGTLTAVSAQTENNQMNTKKSTAVETVSETKAQQKIAVAQEYKEIKMADLPETIQQSFAKDYKGSKISKAYVSGNQEYKLDVANADGTTKTIMADAAGEWLKSDLKQ